MMVKGTPIIAATNTQNGVIYVINSVLTEETTAATVVEQLASSSDTSVFYSLITRSTQIRRLQGQSLPPHLLSSSLSLLMTRQGETMANASLTTP